MHTVRNLAGWVIAIIALPVWAHEAEFLAGRNAAGQLKVHVHFDQPLELEPSIFPGITGYATGLLGLHSAELD